MFYLETEHYNTKVFKGQTQADHLAKGQSTEER